MRRSYRRANEYTSDNYIWFRIAKITKGDTVKISLYEDTGEYKIGSKSSTSNPSTYSISISPKADQLELDQCMRIDSITIDSDEPNVYSLDARYWSWEKILFASLTFVSGIALLVIYIIEKKNYINV